MFYKSSFILLLFFSYFSISAQNVQLGLTFEGKATFYHNKFYGRKTASGEVLTKNSYTIAHKTLPFGTMIEIENPRNGKWVVARVNDRGPFTNDAVVDLSYAVCQRLGVNTTVKLRFMIVGENNQVFLAKYIPENKIAPDVSNDLIDEVVRPNDNRPVPLIKKTKSKGYPIKKHKKRKTKSRR